jgi:hypothetical protein
VGVVQVYRLRTFPTLFNKRDANGMIGCRFIEVDTGGRINRHCVEPAMRTLDCLLCVA